ncbi:MAG: beta-L-arabinofuranosidase domain-containing protein [Candidatus Limnocylindrales bacterium]|jgi:DUF1680 family protein
MSRGPVAPVVPTPGSTCLRPLGLERIRIDGGFWGDRLTRNRTVTIPHGLAQLALAGNLDNLRLAAGAAVGQYRAPIDDAGKALPFMDSDVYKWLEAVGWGMATATDRGLANHASQIIDLVASAQRDDGYLDTYFQVAAPGREFSDLEWGHELYCLGHLIQAAIAWDRSQGDDRLLRVAERAVDRVHREMGPGQRELVDGHPEIEMALVELYRTTSNPRHLELARLFVERRGRGLLGAGRFGPRYWQDHERVRAAGSPAGHAVRQVYLDCGAVDVAIEMDDSELLEAVIARWEAMTQSRTYLTGGLGSRQRDEAFGDAYELPPDLAYAETCGAIGSVMLSWRLLLATGEPRFSDLIERTLFNAVLAGVSLDGAGFFYSNPLHRRSGGLAIRNGPTANSRRPWFPCACCPPNLMRLLATQPDLAATVGNDGITIQQPISGHISAPLPGGEVSLRLETAYPWGGELRVTIDQAPAEEWALGFRVPAWATDAVIEWRDGSRRVGPGCAEVTRRWSADESVILRMGLGPHLTSPDPRIDAIRGTLAVERGPLVFALEEIDLPEGMSFESVELDPAAPIVNGPADVEGLSGIVPVVVGVACRADERMVWPYAPGTGADAPDEWTGTVMMIPYFAWGNRGASGMRVWIPQRRRPPD